MSTQTIGTNSRWRDKFIATEISRFVREFQTIRIRVTPENVEEIVWAFVHPPYMLQSVTLIDNDEMFNRLKERHRARLQRVDEARKTAPEIVRRFLDERFYEEGGRERYIASGRAELEEIRELLQKAVDQRFVSISRGKEYLDGYDLRKWLKEYGIGIDCSGFVQQALKRLVKVSRVEAGKVSSGESRLDTSFLRCQRVYRDITGDAKYGERMFVEVITPAGARPGDVVVSQNHMRIVVRKVEDKGIIFEVAESTSARDMPMGQTSEEDDVGPRIIQVKYPKPGQPIANQSPLKKRLVDSAFEEEDSEREYVIGRYWEIEQLWSGT